MIFITGGFSAGKRRFAQELLGLSLEDFSCDPTQNTPGFFWEDTPLLPQQLPLLLEKSCVIIPEVGCGIVPMDPVLRRQREEIGAFCCQIAKEAQAVYRVFSGIGIQIK